MFRIRRIVDLTLPRDVRAMKQAQEMLRARLSAVSREMIDELPEKILNPFKDRFRYVLLVADDVGKPIRGFALFSHDAQLNFCFLDYLSSSSHKRGRGVGGALYDTVREEARALRSVGIFFECTPDDASLCSDPEDLKDNIARLKFYENYGARPIINTKYELPLIAGDESGPHLVFDDLSSGVPLNRDYAKEVVRNILERKYRNFCSPQYVSEVVNSFKDDPVQIRPPKYGLEPIVEPTQPKHPWEKRISLVVNDKHAIHHVRSRGYVESPVRVRKILDELQKADFFERVDAWNFPEKHIRAVHDRDFLSYVKKMVERLDENETVYPYVFPLRNQSRPPEDLPVQVGYYCMDTFTPLNRSAYVAARSAVDCSLTAAETILEGRMLAYALVRPPGHHAERGAFGGFCYFSNCAIAAQYMSEFGKVAILDVDYHHGNGQQDIFYSRSDVLTVSIHCHPRHAYPYFTGFEDETGKDEGKGFNTNIALPESVNGEEYRVALQRALRKVSAFKPRFLIVALGVDTAKGDPTGTWSLDPKDFKLNGEMIGELKLPTLVIQEGGYKTTAIGKNVLAFFRGLWGAAFAGAELASIVTAHMTTEGAETVAEK